jgi:hypothetical protein
MAGAGMTGIAVVANLGRAGFAYAGRTVIVQGARITVTAARAVCNGCSLAHIGGFSCGCFHCCAGIVRGAGIVVVTGFTYMRRIANWIRNHADVARTDIT